MVKGGSRGSSLKGLILHRHSGEQHLAARPSFPDQGWKLGFSSESTKSSALDQEGLGLRLWAPVLVCLEKKIAKETEGRKESKACTRKAEHTQRDSQVSSESRTLGSLDHLPGGSLLVFVFLWPVVLLWPYSRFISGSSLCARASFSQDGIQHESPWEVSKTYNLASSPFLTPKEPFCACSIEVLLIPRMGNMWAPDLLPKQGLVPLCPCHCWTIILKCP